MGIHLPIRGVVFLWVSLNSTKRNLLMNSTAQLSINKENLVKNTLRHAFSGRNSTLKELAQNARRAGATWVHITMNFELDILTVGDDGVGIKDMNTLFSVAESGWSDDVILNEGPFGVGFLSALYQADRVIIQSCGQRLKANTEDILAFKPIEIESTIDNGMTEISLHGGGISKLFDTLGRENGAFKNVEDMFLGFPIKVSVNNELVNRSHACNSEDIPGRWNELPDGTLLQRYTVSETTGIEFTNSWIAYYQGVEISRNSLHYIRPNSAMRGASIIHLDSNQWEAIAPDRHSLVDAGEADKRIQDLFKQERGRLLDVLVSGELITAPGVDSEEVILSSYQSFLEHGKLDVYNTIERLPRGILEHFSSDSCARYDTPIMEFNWGLSDTNVVKEMKVISKQAILDKNVVVYEDSPNCEDGSCYRYAMYLWSKREESSFWLDCSLDKGHWIYQYTHRVYDEDNNELIQVEFNELREPTIPLVRAGLDMGVRMCDSYVLNGPSGPSEMHCQAFVYIGDIIVDNSVEQNVKIMIVPKDEKGGECLLQASSYFWNDSFNEDHFKLDELRFESWLTKERVGNDPELLLANLLREAAQSFPQLRKKTFEVTFSEDGLIYTASLKNVKTDSVTTN